MGVGPIHLCNATTNSNGVARCPLSAESELCVLLENRYSASLAGDSDYLASSASTNAVVFF